MSDIQKLIGFVGELNIAEFISDEENGENTLKALATQVIEDFQRDQDSMIEWSNMVDEGQRIAKQETASKSDPWEGASNFKSSAIIEASITFGDRASTELLRGRNLVKADVIGNDDTGQKKQAADNIVEFMNWQINHQMKGWRKGQEKLLYELPPTGAVFKKVFFDPIDGVNKSELVHYPDFVINQATTSMADAKSFTHPMDFSVNEVFERQQSGMWLDVDLYPEDSEGDEGSNEEQQVVNSIDNEQRFLEQNCFFDLDDDGYREPYTVTVHQQSQQVVRIVARYDSGSVVVKDDNDVIRRLLPEDRDNLDNLELVKIDAIQNVVAYDFIPSTDGTFLGLGYYHLLSSLSKAINGTTNQLMDSGTLANLQGGFLAKGFKKRMGNLRMKPGQWESTDISAADLQNGIVPHRFKEPSATLFALNEKLDAKITQLTVSTDLKGVLSPNAPATTTLALIQESMVPMSAIMQRIIMSESEEFKNLFILDSKFTDPELYRTVLDDPTADFNRDFNLAAFDITPTANAEMSSRMQRIQQAEALTFRAQEIALTGGDVRPIWEKWFDAMGADDLLGQVFPDPQQMSEEQAARIEAQQNQQRRDDQLLQIDVDHRERELVRREQETQAKLAEVPADIKKTESETILNLEKAESEDVKNQVSKYTANLKAVDSAIDNTIREQDNDQRLSREPTRPTTIPPNIPG